MTWADVKARWAEEVGAALGFTSDTPLLGLSQEGDYQGSCYFVAFPEKDTIVVYGWSYGSCSGCDGWEGNESDIEPEVKAGAKQMTISEFDGYAAAILATPPSYDYGASNYTAIKQAVAAIGGQRRKA